MAKYNEKFKLKVREFYINFRLFMIHKLILNKVNKQIL